ncbi:MAG TPA: SgcJ/EcaC family oxidoreductase [Candidatus Saccharimonadales bacterium]|nr:SgcJ/EcaC family oxidoreductase [Candidatus Saccharimonadales bacterium]
MKRLILAATAITLLTSQVTAQERNIAKDEAAIKKLIDGLNESFQKRDAKLRASLFTADGVFINAFGVQKEGKAAIEQFWKELFATGTFNQTEVKITDLRIKFLTPDVALVDRFEEATGQRGTESGRLLPARRIHLTLIMKRSGDGWLNKMAGASFIAMPIH